MSVSLTNTAWRSLDKEAHRRGISRSEVIERFARTLESEQLFPAQETEGKVAAILESITDAFVAFDRDWRYTYVNQAAAQILHKTPEELLGKHVWNEVFPELVGGIAYRELHWAVAQQVPVSWEEFGEPVESWIEANAYPSAEGVAVYFRNVTQRKRLESELRQREQQFKMVAENAPDIISRVDAEFRHLYVSASVELATGIPSEQFVGKTNVELGMPEDLYRVWHDSLRQVFATGQEQTIEFKFPTLNGIRWYQARIVPEFASDDSVETVLSIARDVTDYKQVEQALRESEERLRLALTATQMVVWDMDLPTNQVLCSANALEVWGFQEGTGEDFFALIHPDDRQRVIQAAQRAISGEQSYAQEYRVISPDGVVRWLNSQGQVYLDETERGVRLIGVSIDITERKQIEAERDRLLKGEQAARLEAETERQRLHDILMQLPAMIAIVKGADLVYEFANPTYLQGTGRTPGIIGKSIRDVFPEIEGQIYFEAFDRVYRTGETFIREESPTYWDRNGDGVLEEAFFHCIFAAWRDAEGTIQGVLIYNIEVTAQVRARQQIEQLLENLQQKEEIQQFLIELNDAIRAIQNHKKLCGRWFVPQDNTSKALAAPTVELILLRNM